MNNTSIEQDRAEKRRRMMGGGLIMVLALAGCAYFLPSHPIVVAAVIFGFLLSIWREREARRVFDLGSSFFAWAMSTLVIGLVKIFQWPLKKLGIQKGRK